MPLVEAVPNVSEGRRPEVLAALTAAVSDQPGVALLDRSADAVHHRSVFTVIGEPDALIAALLRLYATAIESVDLGRHEGVHPRVGAVDVTPFVPLTPDDMDRCVDAARRLGREVARRFDLPVFFYEAAASAPHRHRLEAIRRGGLRGLTARLAEPDWQPDCGPATAHPSAGVTVIGARPPLVAFNVHLATGDLDVARRIARTIRTSGGGLPAVKAMGVATADPATMQVSMNLVDYRRTSVRAAYDAVAKEAARLGVSVRDSQIIGLAPAAALLDAATNHLRLRDFNSDRLLEPRVLSARPAGPPPAGAT